MAAMVQSVFTMAQTVARPAAKQNEVKAGWQPTKLGVDGSNVQNGVEFYNQKSECNAQQVTLVKLINRNVYPVNVSYQISSESPLVNVKVPALATVEGSCSVADANLAKLALSFPKEKTEDEIKKLKEYLKSHIVVSKTQ